MWLVNRVPSVGSGHIAFLVAGQQVGVCPLERWSVNRNGWPILTAAFFPLFSEGLLEDPEIPNFPDSKLRCTA